MSRTESVLVRLTPEALSALDETRQEGPFPRSRSAFFLLLLEQHLARRSEAGEEEEAA